MINVCSRRESREAWRSDFASDRGVDAFMCAENADPSLRSHSPPTPPHNHSRRCSSSTVVFSTYVPRALCRRGRYLGRCRPFSRVHRSRRCSTSTGVFSTFVPRGLSRCGAHLGRRSTWSDRSRKREASCQGGTHGGVRGTRASTREWRVAFQTQGHHREGRTEAEYEAIGRAAEARGGQS